LGIIEKGETMRLLSSYKKSAHLFLTLLLLLGPQVLGGQILFAFAIKERNPEPEIIIENVTDMQDRYDNMSPTAPGMVMFETSTTTSVSAEMAQKIDEELSRQLVISGKIKPVSMEKWLTSTYFERKARNPFILMNAIKAENYAIPLQFLCKPYVFKCEEYFIFHMNVYSIAANTSAYPISILRMFETIDDIPMLVSAVLDEMQLRMYEQKSGIKKKRIIIEEFSLDFLKLVALESGEFEFINAPFIDQYGISLRDGDDFFSLILGYILSATQMYEVMRTADFSAFALSSGFNNSVADYRIQGRVQLSSELSVLYVTVIDVTKNNSLVTSIKFPLYDSNLKNIWNAYREISVKIIESIQPSINYGVVPVLTAEERGFYINNMFTGWDVIENVILPKGMHEIHTGSYFRADTLKKEFEHSEIADWEMRKQIGSTKKDAYVKTFYILLDTMNRVFTNREGEYAWNFLNKN
jgi:hypothetical protein